jgi:hypothetical protein
MAMQLQRIPELEASRKLRESPEKPAEEQSKGATPEEPFTQEEETPERPSFYA